VEPFAGGAGASLRLLVDEYVENIELNDLDAGVAAFWKAVFFHTEALVDRIANAHVTVAEWRKQRDAYASGNARLVDLAFATFFLNRTNRSGILDARPIGGLGQSGRWSVDARFNREELAKRVLFLGRYRNRVTVQRRDGLEFLRDHFTRFANDTLYYVDPPYLTNGADLYLDTLAWADHQQLARLLTKSPAKWILTYDCDSRVPITLYPRNRCIPFTIAHTAATQHLGTEYAVFSKNLEISESDVLQLMRSDAN